MIITILASLILWSAPPPTGDTAAWQTDSNTTLEAALEGSSAPDSLLRSLTLVPVAYWGFDSLPHRGQIVVRADLQADVQTIFDSLFQWRFPVESVIPVRFDLPDNRTTMETMNNTYGFHYRVVEITRSTKLSNHSYGTSIDINPFQNPAILRDGRILPEGAAFNPSAPGTLTADSPVVKLFRRFGWEWGGSWTSLKDYMHFEKKSAQKGTP